MTLHLTHPAELVESVGRTIGTTGPYKVLQDQVNLFAEATGDFQWIHTDPDRAADGPFGGTVAHGYLTLSLAPSILAEALTVDGVDAALNYGLNKVRFPAPLPVGSVLRAPWLSPQPNRSRPAVEAVFRLTYEIDGGTRPVCVADVVVLYT